LNLTFPFLQALSPEQLDQVTHMPGTHTFVLQQCLALGVKTVECSSEAARQRSQAGTSDSLGLVTSEDFSSAEWDVEPAVDGSYGNNNSNKADPGLSVEPVISPAVISPGRASVFVSRLAGDASWLQHDQPQQQQQQRRRQHAPHLQVMAATAAAITHRVSIAAAAVLGLASAFAGATNDDTANGGDSNIVELLGALAEYLRLCHSPPPVLAKVWVGALFFFFFLVNHRGFRVTVLFRCARVFNSTK
jgi:hypothetical protein